MTKTAGRNHHCPPLPPLLGLLLGRRPLSTRAFPHVVRGPLRSDNDVNLGHLGAVHETYPDETKTVPRGTSEWKWMIYRNTSPDCSGKSNCTLPWLKNSPGNKPLHGRPLVAEPPLTPVILKFLVFMTSPTTLVGHWSRHCSDRCRSIEPTPRPPFAFPTPKA